MKIFISHPEANKLKLSDESPVNIESIKSIEDASCTSIQMNNILDFIPPENRENALSVIVSKTRIDGIVQINGVDILVMGDYISNHLVSIDEINASLFQGRVSTDSVLSVSKKLQALGFSIELIKLDGFIYNIIAKRKPLNV